MKKITAIVLTGLVFLGCSRKERPPVAQAQDEKITGTGAIPTSSSPIPFGFVDESTHDPAFLKFKTNLIASLRNNERTRFIGSLAEDITVLKTYARGKDTLASALGITSDDTQWALVRNLFLNTLSEGGCFDGDSAYYAPYYHCGKRAEFCDGPEGEGGWCGKTAQRSVRVFLEPDSNSKPLEDIKDTQVRIIGDVGCGDCHTQCKWKQIALADGKLGYARHQDIADYMVARITFVQRGGKWVIGQFFGPGVNCPN